MKAEIINDFFEAAKQLSEIMTDRNTVYSRTPKKGYMRGIDYYNSASLLRCLAICFHNYRCAFGVYPNIVNPIGFNEKILWFKFFSEIKIPESGNKLLTSSFIPNELKETISCPEIVWHSKKAVLPHNDQIEAGIYYLKSNHGCGMLQRIQYPLTIEAKASLEETCRTWLNIRFGVNHGEWWYDTFPKEILIEKSISEDIESMAWCFYTFKNINPFISAAIKRKNKIDTVWMDGLGNPLATQKNNDSIESFTLPKKFLDIKQQALAIGRNHNFIRVDFLLDSDEKAYLGEITFSPGNGLTKRPQQIDLDLGTLWEHTQLR